MLDSKKYETLWMRWTVVDWVLGLLAGGTAITAAMENASSEALMFPTFGRGKGKGQAVPRHAKNFLKWRIRPIAQRLGIPTRLITFQVMRRSLGTHLSRHGPLKDTQGALRHASITTTGNAYVQVVEESVMRAVNSHASTVLEGWTPALKSMRLTGVT